MKCECDSEDDVRLVMLRAPGVNKWLAGEVPMCKGCRKKNWSNWRYAKKLPVTYSK